MTTPDDARPDDADMCRAAALLAHAVRGDEDAVHGWLGVVADADLRPLVLALAALLRVLHPADSDAAARALTLTDNVLMTSARRAIARRREEEDR